MLVLIVITWQWVPWWLCKLVVGSMVAGANVCGCGPWLCPLLALGPSPLSPSSFIWENSLVQCLSFKKHELSPCCVYYGDLACLCGQPEEEQKNSAGGLVLVVLLKHSV